MNIGYNTTCGRNNQTVFDELKNVMASGIKLVYVLGNHDMLLESGILDEALPGIVQPRDSKGLGVYYTGDRREIAIEHGYRYDVFSVPLEGFEDKVFDIKIDGYNGRYSIKDMFPDIQADGTISAPVLYKDFQRTWQERQQINQVKVKNEFVEAVAGILSREYFFNQAKTQYLQNPDGNIDVVVFGHTHVPNFQKVDGGKY